MKTVESSLDRVRNRLLRRFRSKIAVSPHLNRSKVSFQSNRDRPFYRWFKYKEGFSADLVQWFLKEHSPGKQCRVLDPFAGAGAALFASRDIGCDAHGIEVMPVGVFAIRARLAAERVPWKQFQSTIADFVERFPSYRNTATRPYQHLRITAGAFASTTENCLNRFRSFVKNEIEDKDMQALFDLACLNILEAVSFTRKDGQYLRWDERAKRSHGAKSFNKGEIPSFQKAINVQLEMMLGDLAPSDWAYAECAIETGKLTIDQASCFHFLPTLPDQQVDLVITSPPYCNRYDYTRSYALELAYLGIDNEGLKQLRQALLSCTVENRAKVDDLRHIYEVYQRETLFRSALSTFESQEVLQGILDHLDELARNDDLNNGNIPRMVRNYFLESAVVIHELMRLLKPGGRVIMVNDNVQYAGEEVPVDLILADFATSAGFVVEHIWTLGRGKGNSSQQMGEHGRKELRKCAYVWRKPLR